MLRAAFALAALSVVAARHDEARHEHEHDERHCVGHIPNHERDLINMQIGTRTGTNLITCNQMQTKRCNAHEDDKHEQDPRTYHTTATSEPSNAPIGGSSHRRKNRPTTQSKGSLTPVHVGPVHVGTPVRSMSCLVRL